MPLGCPRMPRKPWEMDSGCPRMPPDAPGCPSRMPSQNSVKSVRSKGGIASNAQSTCFPMFSVVSHAVSDGFHGVFRGFAWCSRL